MGKVQTNLKGEVLRRFKRYMEITKAESEYEATRDLIIRGLMDFEREKANPHNPI